MSVSENTYLDNAATSFPKPEAVYDAVDHYNRHLGVAVGRGAFQQAVLVQGVVDRCRQRAAQLLGAESPARIAFTFNGTDGLNLAIHGVLSPGDHVVTSTMEHNSVRRPLCHQKQQNNVTVTYVTADKQGRVEPARLRVAIQPNTKLIVLTHASNVTGTIQPIADVAAIAREKDVLFLVDAAQSAGHVPIDVSGLGIDLLASSGHKGLLGPLGTGLLYIRPGVEENLRAVRQGGTGSNSEDDHQPEILPDKYEAGNHNAPGLFGLEAALAFLQEQSVESIRAHERKLTARLLDGLAEMSGLTVFGPPGSHDRVGVVSIAVSGFEPQVLATILDENFRIQTRAGLHCAPGAHRAMGSFDSGGTVRLSSGPFTTAEQIDKTLDALREISGAV